MIQSWLFWSWDCGRKGKHAQINKYGIVVMFLLVFTAGCSSTKTSDSAVVAIPTDPEGFHPITLLPPLREIAFNIYEGLAKAAPDGSLFPPWLKSGAYLPTD